MTDSAIPTDDTESWRTRLGRNPVWIAISVLLTLALMAVQPLFAIPVVFLFLWLSGAGLPDIRLRPFRLSDIVTGLAAAVVLQVVNRLAILPVLAQSLPVPPSSAEALGLVPGAWSMLLIFAPIAMISAGFGEELAARGYAMTRLSKLFGGGAAARWTAMIFVAVVFGAAHFYQGMLGAAHAVWMGMALGALTLSRGSLWASITAHGVYNLLTGLLIVSGAIEALERAAPWTAL